MIKFLKHSIKFDNQKTRVWYHKGNYTKESKLPQGTITIYAKDYGAKFPKEFNIENNSDMMTDYFEKSRVRLTPKNKYWKNANKFLK